MGGLWKFLYWPIVWALALGLPFLMDNLRTIEGYAGIALRIIGIVIISWAFMLHGIAGRTLRYKGHTRPGSIWPDKLVTVGVYSCMRHPQHMGLTLTPIGIAALLASPAALIASGWAVAAALVFVLFIEEPECLDKFGQDYHNYMKRVPAFNFNPRCIKTGIEELKGG